MYKKRTLKYVSCIIIYLYVYTLCKKRTLVRDLHNHIHTCITSKVLLDVLFMSYTYKYMIMQEKYFRRFLHNHIHYKYTCKVKVLVCT